MTRAIAVATLILALLLGDAGRTAAAPGADDPTAPRPTGAHRRPDPPAPPAAAERPPKKPQAEELARKLGLPMIAVLPGSPSFGSGAAGTLSQADVDALADSKRCPAVRAVAPVVRAHTQVAANDKTWVPIYVLGTTPTYLDVRDWKKLSRGEPFTVKDGTERREVCLLGQTVARELFGKEDPIGKKVRINHTAFTVRGVLARKGANLMGLDQDDIVLVPWQTLRAKVKSPPAAPAAAQPVDTLKQLYPAGAPARPADRPLPKGQVAFDLLIVGTRTYDDIPQAVKEITAVLRKQHGLGPKQPDDFSIRDLSGIYRAWKGAEK